MLRVILIDDEPLARQALRQLCAEASSLEVIGEAAGVGEARELIQREKPDAVFLDVRMPGGDGFDLIAGLEQPPLFVVVTAYSEHAVRAFEFEAVDYLLKPVRLERFVAAVRRLEVIAGETETEKNLLRQDDRLCLRTPGRTIIVALDRVVALVADGDFTRVHVRGETSPVMICQRLGSYEMTLPNPPFVRLGRSLIVNLATLVRTRQVSRDAEEIWLDGLEEPFLLGRTAQARLRAALSSDGGR